MLVFVAIGETVETKPRRRASRVARIALTITAILALLFVVPWWTLLLGGNHWPGWVVVLGTIVFAGALVAFPVLMIVGHGRHRDWAARIGDVELGVIWVLFVWSILGNVLRLILLA